MKRSMAGGAHRGPVGLQRQRRTIRFVQLLLVLIAAGLLLFAGYSWGRASGFDAARATGELGVPRRPSTAQVIVLGALGLMSLGGAVALQGRDGVRLPTPARLDELATRAEGVAIERAERAARDQAGGADPA